MKGKYIFIRTALLIVMMFLVMASSENINAEEINRVSLNTSTVDDGTTLQAEVEATGDRNQAIVLNYKNTQNSAMMSIVCDYSSAMQKYIGSYTVSSDLSKGKYEISSIYYENNPDFQMSYSGDSSFIKTDGSQIAQIDSIQIQDGDVSLKEGESKKLEVTISPSDQSAQNVQWSSKNTSVVTVSSDGTVKAVSTGVTTVTAAMASADGITKISVIEVLVTKKKASSSKELVIVLDPGHGSQDSGTTGFGLKESEIAQAISDACKEELEKYKGVKVYQTKDSSKKYLSLTQRPAFAKKVKADVFISQHINSAGSTAAGAEIFVTRDTSKSIYNEEMTALAKTILNELEDLGLHNRGAKTRKLPSGNADYYSVIRNSVADGIPAILIEHCFLSNKGDAEFVKTSAGQKKLGIADATGIAKYYGLEKK